MIDSSSRVVVLSESEYEFKERVCLCNMKGNKLHVDFDYGKHEYIKDFIKKLVLYRYENDIKQITEKDLLIFLIKYIKDNKELIVESNKKRYLEILKNCDEQVCLSDAYYKGCMHARNRYMVDRADCMIAYLKKQEGGTAFTVALFEKKNAGREIFFI
jgi:hypothetical protein